MSRIVKLERSKTVEARRSEMVNFVLNGSTVRQSDVFKQLNVSDTSNGQEFQAEISLHLQ